MHCMVNVYHVVLRALYLLQRSVLHTKHPRLPTLLRQDIRDRPIIYLSA